MAITDRKRSIMELKGQKMKKLAPKWIENRPGKGKLWSREVIKQGYWLPKAWKFYGVTQGGGAEKRGKKNSGSNPVYVRGVECGKWKFKR